MGLVCELGMQLQMRQCDCNSAAGLSAIFNKSSPRTFCAPVFVVCLVRYAMAAVRSLVLTKCVSFDCVLGLL